MDDPGRVNPLQIHVRSVHSVLERKMNFKYNSKENVCITPFSSYGLIRIENILHM